MTYAEFRKTHPAIRSFLRYGVDERSNRASSRRMGHRQREAVGEFFYTHPLCGDIAFPTAKAATTRAYELAGQGGA